MDPWAQHFVELWQAKRVDIAETILAAIKANPHILVKEYTLDDIHQMFDGVLAILVEQISGEGTDIWDLYMESVIPGVLAQGQPLSALVGQCTMNAMLLHQLLVPAAQKKHRAKISQLLLNFYTQLNSEIVKIGLQVGVKS